ncbi:MAG: hypothetical protein HXK96_00960 [Candidatus Nanogingivalaceae bacterium]|nr:hypothetical protein [Candidatus Nanogingivalaceae bacterium]
MLKLSLVGVLALLVHKALVSVRRWIIVTREFVPTVIQN